MKANMKLSSGGFFSHVYRISVFFVRIRLNSKANSPNVPHSQCKHFPYAKQENWKYKNGNENEKPLNLII